MMAKVPGKHYRDGVTLIEVLDMFPDEDEDIFWPTVSLLSFIYNSLFFWLVVF